MALQYSPSGPVGGSRPSKDYTNWQIAPKRPFPPTESNPLGLVGKASGTYKRTIDQKSEIDKMLQSVRKQRQAHLYAEPHIHYEHSPFVNQQSPIQVRAIGAQDSQGRRNSMVVYADQAVSNSSLQADHMEFQMQQYLKKDTSAGG